MDLLVDEPGTRRMVVDTMQGMIKEKNTQQGKMPAIRADLRMGAGPNGQLLVLNKRDGIIRLLVP